MLNSKLQFVKDSMPKIGPLRFTLDQWRIDNNKDRDACISMPVWLSINPEAEFLGLRLRQHLAKDMPCCIIPSITVEGKPMYGYEALSIALETPLVVVKGLFGLNPCPLDEKNLGRFRIMSHYEKFAHRLKIIEELPE